MNKKVNAKITQYLIEFKNNVRDRALEIEEVGGGGSGGGGSGGGDGNRKKPISDFIAYLYEYPRLVLTDEDFSKRKREKNTIPVLNRCNAKRSCGNQCTRKRKDGFEFCGTHYKGAPHGFVKDDVGDEGGGGGGGGGGGDLFDEDDVEEPLLFFSSPVAAESTVVSVPVSATAPAVIESSLSLSPSLSPSPSPSLLPPLGRDACSGHQVATNKSSAPGNIGGGGGGGGGGGV